MSWLPSGRWPRRHYWDQFESRLLVVEASGLPNEHPLIKRSLQKFSDTTDKRPLQSSASENQNSLMEDDLRLHLKSTSPSSNLTGVQSRPSPSKVTDLSSPIKEYNSTKVSSHVCVQFDHMNWLTHCSGGQSGTFLGFCSSYRQLLDPLFVISFLKY